jgi:hypothetical protein
MKNAWLESSLKEEKVYAAKTVIRIHYVCVTEMYIAGRLINIYAGTFDLASEQLVCL